MSKNNQVLADSLDESTSLQVGANDEQSFDSFLKENNLAELSASTAKFITSAILCAPEQYASRFANEDCECIFVTASASIIKCNFGDYRIYHLLFKYFVNSYKSKGYISKDELIEEVMRTYEPKDAEPYLNHIIMLEEYYKNTTEAEREAKCKDFANHYQIYKSIFYTNRYIGKMMQCTDVLSDKAQNYTSQMFDDLQNIQCAVKSDNLFAEKSREFWSSDWDDLKTIERVTTGVQMLDEYTNGGVGRGEVNLIVAPTGVGKTQWAIALSDHLSRQGYKVLHIDYEMRLKGLKGRFMSRLSGIPSDDVDLIKHVQPSTWRKYRAEIDNLGKNITMYCAENTRLSASDIIHYTRSLMREGWTPDIIIIDYFDKIAREDCDANSINVNEYEGRTMHLLEQLANETNACVWTFSQMKKEATKRNKQTIYSADMITGSAKKLEQVAFAMVFDDVELETGEKQSLLSIIKNRNGICKQFEIKVNKECSRIYSVGQQTVPCYTDREDERLSLIADISKWKYDYVQKKQQEDALKNTFFANDNTNNVPF